MATVRHPIVATRVRVDRGREDMTTIVDELKAQTAKATSVSVSEIIDSSGYGTAYVGSDPEVFLVNKETRDIAPAYEYLPTDRLMPIYADGFAAEMKTTPKTCIQYAVQDLRECLIKLRVAIKSKTQLDIVMSTQNVMRIGKKMRDSAPEESVRLGCSQSYNVYGDSPKMPTDGRELGFRTTGGHIHVGCGKMTDERVKSAVKNCDLLAGVGTVALFAGFEDAKRRELYGRAGEFRLPSHGIEYRVPSGVILGSPIAYNFTLELVRGAVGMGKLDVDLMGLLKIDEQVVRDVINGCDVKGARELYREFSYIWHRVLYGMYRSISSRFHEQLYKTVDTLFKRGLGAIDWQLIHGQATVQRANSWSTECPLWNRYEFGNVEKMWFLDKGAEISGFGHSCATPASLFMLHDRVKFKPETTESVVTR